MSDDEDLKEAIRRSIADEVIEVSDSSDEEPKKAIHASSSSGASSSSSSGLIGLLDLCEYFMNHALDIRDIEARRLDISRRWRTPTREKWFGKNTGPISLEEDDLAQLFALYDETFFEGALRKRVHSKGSVFKIKPSKKLTRTAGLCAYDPGQRKHRCEYWIEISINVLNKTFHESEAHDSGGVLCHSRIECMQLVLEHEMIHLLTYLWEACDAKPTLTRTGKTVAPDAHDPIFKQLVKNIFGQTRVQHSLLSGLTQDQITNFSLKNGDVHVKGDLRVGMLIEFGGSSFRITQIKRKKMVVERTDNGNPYLIRIDADFTIKGEASPLFSPGSESPLFSPGSDSDEEWFRNRRNDEDVQERMRREERDYIESPDPMGDDSYEEDPEPAKLRKASRGGKITRKKHNEMRSRRK